MKLPHYNHTENVTILLVSISMMYVFIGSVTGNDRSFRYDSPELKVFRFEDISAAREFFVLQKAWRGWVWTSLPGISC